MQAVMLGPHVMAGLTHNSRKIAAFPSALPSMVTDLSTDGLVSIRMPAALSPNTTDRQYNSSMPNELFLQHRGGAPFWGPVRHNGEGLDASFKMWTMNSNG